jgi:DNA replicative helicase MCM subunit Mcm2 (Cdc46/Mcm family)
MSSKITVELYCDKCGTDSMVTYDPDNTVDEPIFCPFCAELATENDLDFEKD